MLVSALRDHDGHPISDQRYASLLEDDLEEVINTSTTRTDGARPKLETLAAVRAECAASKERLLKNLRYIIAHKERWSIMFHVRSSLSHLARLAFTRLLRRLCADGKRYALRAPGAQSVPIPPL